MSAPRQERADARVAELAALISEQELDRRTGDRVFGRAVSLDAAFGRNGDGTLYDLYLPGGRSEPRHELRTKRIRGLLGSRIRKAQARRRYGGVCESCAAITDGSNGRGKAPRVCATCLTAAPHAIQQAALAVLEQPSTIQDVADLLSVSHTTAKRNIYALIRAGLVQRRDRGVYTRSA